ncbi:JAB domain-containing protein [Luminiphilus syltensis]|nr:DNA repair protein RadC [Luminiphilus syltensis]
MNAPIHSKSGESLWSEDVRVPLLARAMGLDPWEAGVSLANALRENNDCLRSLMRRIIGGPSAIGGIDDAARARLIAALELGDLLAEAGLYQRDLIASAVECRRFLQRRLGKQRREVFSALYLDSRNRLIVAEDLFAGTIDGAAVFPREVVRGALLHDAASVIVAHNHPSGALAPSEQDRQLTRRLSSALSLVDIRLLDHFIVGFGDSVSLASLGEC